MSETYSDGEAFEREAVERIRAAADRSALADLTGGASDLPWPVRYHLDPSRANLLRPFDFSGLAVLDLGAGMGAATRWAAESAREFVAVEGSPLRAEGLAARLAGLPQARVVVSPLEELEPEPRFDVVCLVGVLEHAERWVRPPAGWAGSAFDYVLARAASWLAPGGLLLLAIENRLGLKFWTGATEEHTGRLFDGIAGYRLGRSERTFSRLELTQLLARAGLTPREWLFPFPDYKLPVSVLAEGLVSADPELAAELAASRAFLDPARSRLDLVPDPLALAGAARAGLLAELANSFLVLAAREPEPRVWHLLRRGGAEIGWHFALDRRERVRTVFSSDGDTLSVGKRLESGAIGPLALDARLAGLRWEGHAARPVERGASWRLRLLRRIAFGEEREGLDELAGFVDGLLHRFARGAAEVDGAALDATVANALRSPSGETRLFDLEWRLEGPLPASWLLLRNVLALAGAQGRFPLAAGTLRELHRALGERLALPVSPDEDLTREIDFAAAVRSTPRERLERELATLLAAPFPGPTLLGAPPDAGTADTGEHERLEHEYRRLEEHARSLERLVSSQQATYAELEAYARSLERRLLPQVLTVIVHPRATPQLEHCLRAALASEGVAVTIVLLLNGCDDPLPGWMDGEPRIHVLRLTDPLGFGAANNRAVQWALARLPAPHHFFFLNNDAALRRDALRRMIEALDAEPRAGVAGPTLVVWGAEDHLNSLGLNLTRTAEAWDEGIGLPTAAYGPLPGRHEVVAVTGAALLVRAETWRELGGWSELFDFYMEDLDLCLRAQGLGWKVVQVADAEAAHAVSATAGAFSEFKVRLFWRNRWVLLLLHWPLPRLLGALPRVIAGELALHRRRLAVGAVDDARRQRRSWGEVFRMLPRIARERRWRGVAREWVRHLRPAGSVPVITLPHADQSGAPWATRAAGDEEVR